MEKEFVPYDLALALKELGLDEPCLGWYQDNTLRLDINANQSIKFHNHLGRFKGCFIAPTFSQVFRWFREKHQLTCWVDKRKDFVKPYNWYIISNESDDTDFLDYEFHYKTYEEAELECLKKLIQIVKTK
jgi:hypothetical protein